MCVLYNIYNMYIWVKVFDIVVFLFFCVYVGVFQLFWFL